jgi:hypothetical protein
MIFSPLRKAVIAGAGVVALGSAGGVAVHAATSSSPTSATLTATTTTTPSPTPNSSTCVPHRELGIAKQVLGVAAKDTGLTEQQILDQLRAGKTFDDIAGSKAPTVEQDLLTRLKSHLDQAVSSGKLTQDRETAMLDKAKTAIEKAMSSNLSDRIPASGSLQACGGGRGHGEGHKDGLLHTLITVTAQKTGLSEDQVMQDLRNGQSIDQIAGSKAADIKATVLQQMQQDLSSKLDKIMSHSGGLGGGKGHGMTPTTPSPSAGA